VENQGDDVVEAVDEPVGGGRVDEPVKPVVEVGEVLIAEVDLFKEELVTFAALRRAGERRSGGYDPA
jgi:hypothetical protein